MKKLLPVLGFGLAMSLMGCVGPPPRGVTYVRVRPPRPVVEIVTVAPSRDHVWIAGYHRWDGNGHTWVPGHWEARVHPGARWVPGRWKSYNGQWYWIDGRWR